MFHIVAYQVATTATRNVDGTAVTDSIETIQNGHIVPQVDKQLLYAYIGATTLISGRITTPSIRQLSPIEVRPIDAASLPTSRTPIADYSRNPITLKAFEEIQFQATNSAAGPNTATGILALGVGGLQPAPQGQSITMRGTGTTTVTANGWTGCAITWADTLAQGTYAVVGMTAVSVTGVAARLIFDQQVMRPGCIIGATDAIINSPLFMRGYLGVWGVLNAFRMPNVEFLCTSADTAQEVFLEFIRIA